MRTLILLVALLCTSSFLAPTLRADEVYTFIIKKQEEKQQSRWSLSDWLVTKQKFAMQDMWLQAHAPSPYEFSISGDYRGYSNPSGTTGKSFEATAFASLVGIRVKDEATIGNNLSAAVLFRIFGYHDQATNITLVGGARETNSTTQYHNALAGGESTLYILKFFGAMGAYQHFFLNSGISGNRYEVGGFIDFKFLRVYGNYFSESDPFPNAGFAIGPKIYF